MAGIKRKEAPNARDNLAVAKKKAKKKIAAVKKPKTLALPPESRNDAESSIVSKASTSSDVEAGADSSSTDEAAILGPSAQERGEAETDSDPIAESDTTEQSGDDDGISWPSDDEEEVTVVTSKTKSKAEKVADEEDAKHPKGNGVAKGSNDASTGRKMSRTSLLRKDKAKMVIGTSSRESHAKQKAIAQERKASKPNADSIARSKKLWERLRRKSHVPLEERKRLVAELFDIISGHIKDFVLKHDSVRVVQTALKYANIDQRKMIARELKGEYRGLAESRYAKFLIGKLLVHGDAEIRDIIVPELYGHVRRLIKHPEASWILDDIYRGAATHQQKATLLREWYGAEFALFKTKGQENLSADLQKILAAQPEKRKPVMHALHDLINQCLQKKTTGFTMLHDAMLQYYLNLQPGGPEATEFVELLKGDEEGDLLKNLAFTKSGARVVSLALAYSNAKDRKIILKTYKDTIQMLAHDVNGHQVLLTAYDVIDDTVLVAKSIFPELLGKDTATEESQQNLLTSIVDLTGRITILYPFSGNAKWLLPDEDRALLDQVHAIRASTSKKDATVRRKELVAALSPPLLSLIENHAEGLVQTSFGCQFISEILLSATGPSDRAFNAVAELTGGSPEVKEALVSPASGRMLKTLVQGGRFNPKTKTVDRTEPPLKFHEVLFKYIGDDILAWATGGNSFVVVGLWEVGDFSKHETLKCRLKEGKIQLAKAGEAGNKGSQLLLRKLEV